MRAPRTAARFSPSRNDRIYVDANAIAEGDIYCGQTHRGSQHPGNVNFRDTIAMYKPRYQAFGAQYRLKTTMSTSLLEEVFTGRFVKMDPFDGRYFLLTKLEARSKISQGLRETRADPEETKNTNI